MSNPRLHATIGCLIAAVAVLSVTIDLPYFAIAGWTMIVGLLIAWFGIAASVGRLTLSRRVKQHDRCDHRSNT
ncbi:hypothetical protein [Haloglycomyces albus]|uniref:hypothetical protein n=1 Tax=Haloglycomyces albus TaxID=526067 RepID=UPI00046D4B0F|nr:hypothetical protein [Haloglycomyces albus]